MCRELPNLWKIAAIPRVAADCKIPREAEARVAATMAHLKCRFSHELADILFIRGAIGLASSSVCLPLTISIISSSSVDGDLASWPFSKPKS